MHDANATAAATPPPSRPLIASTWEELRRRKVVRAAVSYAVVAFVALQLAEITFEPLGLPSWAMTWAVLAAVLGFPVVLVLAWYFDATAHGIERAPDTRAGPARLFIVGVVMLSVAGVAWWLTSVYRPGRAGSSGGDAPPNSIAVLPFDDLSPTQDQAWFADGLAEELLDRLARLPGLRVAARTSSFAFRGKGADVKEIGRALDVGLVLEGSVRKGDGRVRVTAQLIDTGTGYHLWSEKYDKPEGEILGLQDAITAQIADQLQVRVAAAEGAPEAAGATAATVDVGALEKYLEGRLHWRRRTPASLTRAVELFREALDLDPGFARAWSGLADTYLLQADYGALQLDQAVQLAEPAIVRALALDPRSGEAWASLGLLRMSVGQFDAAQGNLDQAMELDPRYEMAPTWLARVYAAQGRFVEQRQTLERALAINPHEPVINANLAHTLAGAGDVDAARAVLARVLAMLPANDLLLRALANVETQAGRLDAAMDAARKAVAAEPTAPANLGALIDAYVALEDYGAADLAVGELPEGSPQRLAARQVLAMRRGEDSILPELVEYVGTLIGGDRELSPIERDLIMSTAIAHLLARRDIEAAALLRVVCPKPETVTADIQLAEPASMLIVALRRARAVDEAAAWEQAVSASTARWVGMPLTGAQTEYVRALLASMNGRDADAIASLERAYAAGFRDRWWLAHDPRLEPVRDQPGLKALEDRIAADLARMRAVVAAH
jgi:TolB-like protein/Tfp pilus assembly protein PilF